MIAAAEPAGREPSGKREFHLLDIAGREGHRSAGDGRVDRPAIVSSDVGDVLRRLQPTLDLERRHPGRKQLRRKGVGRQILRREQISLVAKIHILAVAEKLVG